MVLVSSCYKKFRDSLISAVSSNGEDSLLSYDESNAIKGVLILLIVLGHNKYVQQGGMSNLYLYSFHVYAFYFLPFLYDFRSISLREFLRKNLIRLYVPYTVVFFVLCGIAMIVGPEPSLLGSIQTYICGSQFLLSQNLGFGSFLWFIPTMFSILFYRWVYYHLGFKMRCLMLSVSALCLIGFAYMIPMFVVTWFYAPFCLTVALGMVLPGVILRDWCRRLDYPVVAMAFFILVIALMVVYPIKDVYGLTYLTINRLICPILIFSFLLSLRKYLMTSKLLVTFGRLSFRIYLIHIFVYNAIYRWCDDYDPGIYFGLVAYALCLAVTLIISKISIIRYVFPR